MSEMGKKPAWLGKNGVYYVCRRRVPEKLRPYLDDRTEIVRSLGTKDHAEAVERLPHKVIEIQNIFKKAEARLKADTANPKLSLADIDSSKIRAIAAEWVNDAINRAKDEIDAYEPGEDDPEVVDIAKEDAMGAQVELQSGNLNAASALTDKLLEEHHIRPNKKHQNYNILRKVLLRAAYEVADFTYHWANDDARSAFDFSPEFQQVTSFRGGHDAGHVAHEPSSISLGDALALYEAVREGEDLKEKTHQTDRGVFAAVRDILETDTPLSKITQAECRYFRDIIKRLPRNAASKLNGKSRVELAEAADAVEVPRLGPVSVNKYVDGLYGFLKWAQEEGHIKDAPKRIRKMKDPVRAVDKRRSFTIEELKGIFNQPLYVGCKDDRNGYATPGPNQPRGYRFWVPLISLFHGMRTEECCQLHVDDIKEIDGVTCIDVSEFGEAGDPNRKTLKNPGSARKVPLHNELRKIGFLKFVDRKRREGNVRLFPDIRRDPYEKLSGPFSRWSNRFLSSAGAKHSDTAFHSFRHTFTDAMKRHGLPYDAQDELCGWSQNGRTGARYGQKDRVYSLKLLKKHMNKVEYEGLDLSHLYETDD